MTEIHYTDLRYYCESMPRARGKTLSTVHLISRMWKQFLSQPRQVVVFTPSRKRSAPYTQWLALKD